MFVQHQKCFSLLILYSNSLQTYWGYSVQPWHYSHLDLAYVLKTN